MTTTVEVPPPDTTTNAAEPPPPAAAADSSARAVRRAHLAPHAAVGALVVAAAAARLAAHAVGDEQTVAAWTAVTAFTIAVVAATRVRRSVFDKRVKRRAYTFLAVAVIWLGGVTATGLTLGAVGLLMAVGYGLALHWWHIHPISPVTAIDHATRVDDTRYADLWQENLATGEGAPLRGTRLTSPDPIPAGIRYALMLRPGRQDMATVQGQIGKIRGGLLLKRDQDLLVEAHPALPEPHLQVTVVTRSPIRESVIHPGSSAFDPDTGRIALGPFADGEGTAWWKAYTDNRLWGGFIQGGTGSGKSRMIESIALTLADATSHPTVIMYGDGQGGASSPLLMRHADVRARTHEQGLAMLEGLLLVILLRQDENAVNGWEGFTPTDDRPGILAIYDECHKPLSKLENPGGWERMQYLIATIAREGGKVGVAALLASQQTTLDVFGGAGTTNSEAIRTNLLAGNGVMLRSKDPNAKTIFGVDVNPKKFPPLGGYGLLVDPDPAARQAPFRGYYVTDRIRDEWPIRINWRSLDPVAAGTWGADYTNRHALDEQALDRVRARLAARRAGLPVMDEVRAAAGKAAAAVGSAVARVAGGFPVWRDMEAQMLAGVTPQPAGNIGLRDGHRKVLDAIGAGCRRPGEIRDATEYSDRQVYNLLDDLLAAGRIRKVKTGHYELVGQEVAA